MYQKRRRAHRTTDTGKPLLILSENNLVKKKTENITNLFHKYTYRATPHVNQI